MNSDLKFKFPLNQFYLTKFCDKSQTQSGLLKILNCKIRSKYGAMLHCFLHCTVGAYLSISPAVKCIFMIINQLVPRWLHVGSTLAPRCFHAGSLWLHVSSTLLPRWFHFGSTLAPRCFHAGSTLVPRCTCSTTSCVASGKMTDILYSVSFLRTQTFRDIPPYLFNRL